VGHSEAGFVAPLAASRSTDVSFLIVYAAPGLAEDRQVVHEVETTLRCAGFAEADIAKAKALRTQLNEAVLQDIGWNELRRAIEASQDEKWFPEARVGRQWSSPTGPMIELHRRYLQYSPISAWRKVAVPVLALYGERDTQVAAAESMRLIEKSLMEAGNANYTLKLFPKANHMFLDAETGCASEIPRLRRIVPGYFDTIRDWSLRYVRQTPQPTKGSPK
jgi:pimeloyl-ACP methyl ester carboxylesterase